MQTISEIRALLTERGLHPKHRLGQNFLHDKNQIGKLIAAADVQAGELVLEVGPGTGTLTEALLDAGAEVIACEIDRGMAGLVADRLPGVTLIEADCLTGGRQLNPAITSTIAGRRFKLVANLPYQVASPLMATLLIEHDTCVGQYVTIQKEVADRLVAQPGTKEYGPLGIIVQAFAEVKRIAVVPPTCFWPQPKVTSAMVAVQPAAISGQTSALDMRTTKDRIAFARFVTEMFSKRRKQLGTILGRNVGWPDGITPDQRPEALSVAQIRALHRSLSENRSPS